MTRYDINDINDQIAAFGFMSLILLEKRAAAGSVILWARLRHNPPCALAPPGEWSYVVTPRGKVVIQGQGDFSFRMNGISGKHRDYVVNVVLVVEEMSKKNLLLRQFESGGRKE